MDKIENINLTNYILSKDTTTGKTPDSVSKSIFVNSSTQTQNNQETSQKVSTNQKVTELQSKLKSSVPKLSNEFLSEVVRISNEIKCSPEDLLAVMYHESNGWKASSYANDGKGNSYGGLIQMNQRSLNLVKKKYAKELGLDSNITMSQYLKLPREKQIKYSEGYLKLMKDYCNLDKNKKISGGELWGMIKSPKLTKAKNKNFFRRLERHINNIQIKIFTSEPKHINIPKA